LAALKMTENDSSFGRQLEISTERLKTFKWSKNILCSYASIL